LREEGQRKRPKVIEEDAEIPQEQDTHHANLLLELEKNKESIKSI
jgi:hypothetical protein